MNPYREPGKSAPTFVGPPIHCLNCRGPKLEWQTFCGAGCCAEYEMRRRSPQATNTTNEAKEK